MAEYKNIIKNEVVITGEKEINRLSGELTATKEELDRVNSTLQSTRTQLSQVQAQFDNFAHNNGIDILEAELERFRDTAQRSMSEFRAFLESVNLNDIYGKDNEEFRHLFKEIEQGSITASQAILEVKTNYRALLEESYNNSGGLFDSQIVQQFSATLEQLGATMDVVLQKITAFERDGVRTIGEASAGDGGNIANILKQIETATAGMSAEAKGAYEPITQLVRAMTDYANLDTQRILGVSQAFRNIADIGSGSYGTKSIENIVYLAKQLQALSDKGTGSIRFDFTGLNDIKVSKASLNNLATYLPQIAEVNASKLQKLSQVNLTNFNNVKVSKSSIEAISQLTAALQVLKETKVAVVKSDANSISIGTSDAKIQAEAAKQVAAATKEAAKESKLNYQDATRAVKEYYSALLQVSKTKNDITLKDGEFRSESGKWSELAVALNRTKTAFDLCTSSSNRSKLSVEEQGNLLRLMAGEAKKYALSLEQLTNKTAETTAKKQDTEVIRQQTAAYKEAANIITQYYKMMTTLNTTKNDIILKDGTYVSESGEWSALADALNRVEQSYKSLDEVKKSLSKVQQAELLDVEAAAYERYAIATDKAAASAAEANAKAANAETIKKQVAAYNEASKAIATYYSLQQQAVKEGSAVFKDGAWVSTRAEYDALAASLNKAQTEFNRTREESHKLSMSEEQQKLITAQLTKAEDDLAIATGKVNATTADTNQKKSDADLIKTQAAAYNEATRIIKEYYNAQQQLVEVKDKISKDDNGVYKTEDTNLQGLVASLNRTAEAYAKLDETKSRASTAQQTELTRQETLAQEQLAIATDKAAASAAEANAKARPNAIKQYYATITQLDTAIKNYTAAEKSRTESSREAYAALKAERNTLIGYETEVKSGAMSVDKIREATDRANMSLAEYTATIKSNGDATKALLGQMGGLAKKFGSWLTVSRIIMYAIRTVRQMISASIELDDAMTQMQIVTKASTSQMDEFADSAASAAHRVGSSISDFIDSATTYARLGYDMGESSQLAEYTAMLQNVGDIDVSDAQDAITSIVKAFDVDTDQIESVMDKLVSTGNNFPISVSEIAEGMNNASSTLSAAGNSFEQSVALLTAANTTINLCRAV